MRRRWVEFCENEIPNRWSPTLVGEQFYPKREPRCFGSVPIIRCVSGHKGLKCLRLNTLNKRWYSLSPVRNCTSYFHRKSHMTKTKPLNMEVDGGNVWCRDQRRGSIVPEMRVPLKHDVHILEHMRCNCSACMNFACQWRKAIKNEFRRHVRDPLVPQRKPHRWMPVLGRCETPGNVNKTHTRHKNRSQRNWRSPQVSWWFGNPSPLNPDFNFLTSETSGDREQCKKTSPSHSVSQTELKSCFDGFENVAMDGTLGESRLQDWDRHDKHDEPVSLTRFSLGVKASPTRHISKRRGRLAQGIMEDDFKSNKNRTDEMECLKYYKPTTETVRTMSDDVNESQAVNKYHRFYDSTAKLHNRFVRHREPKRIQYDLSRQFHNDSLSNRIIHESSSQPNHGLSDKYSHQQNSSQDECCNRYHPWYKRKHFGSSDFTSKSLPRFISPQSFENKRERSNLKIRGFGCLVENDVNVRNDVSQQNLYHHHHHKYQRCPERVIDDIWGNTDKDKENKVAAIKKCLKHPLKSARKWQHVYRDEDQLKCDSDLECRKNHSDSECQINHSDSECGNNHSDENFQKFCENEDDLICHIDRSHTNYQKDKDHYRNDEENTNYQKDKDHYRNDEGNTNYHSDKLPPKNLRKEKYEICQANETLPSNSLNKNISKQLPDGKILPQHNPDWPGILTNKIVLTSGKLKHHKVLEHDGDGSFDSPKNTTVDGRSHLPKKLHKHWTALSPEKFSVSSCRPSCENKHLNETRDYNEIRETTFSDLSEASHSWQKCSTEDKRNKYQHSFNGCVKSHREKKCEISCLSKTDLRECNSQHSTTKRHCKDSSFYLQKQCRFKTPRNRSCSRSRSRENITRKPIHNFTKAPDLNQSTLSQAPVYSDDAKYSLYPNPFGPSERVIRGDRPKTRPDWLQNHLSLMNECSYQRQKNATFRTERIVDKTNALSKCSENLRLDFDHLHDRLDKVKDQQQRYFERIDEAIHRIQDRKRTNQNAHAISSHYPTQFVQN